MSLKWMVIALAGAQALDEATFQVAISVVGIAREANPHTRDMWMLHATAIEKVIGIAIMAAVLALMVRFRHPRPAVLAGFVISLGMGLVGSASNLLALLG